MNINRIFKKRFLVFLLPCLMPLGVAAHGGEDHEGAVWPPQPTGISNVVDHSDPVGEKTIQSVEDDSMNQLEQKASVDPMSSRALGNRFAKILSKVNETNGQIKMVFFSYDKNTTVEVEFENGEVESVNSVSAGKYQPEIIDAEAAQAVELARAYFLNHGVAKVANLEGFSILAYKPDGAGFYDTRVIYVSFHENNDSPPQFVAWVDLSNQIIITAREDK